MQDRYAGLSGPGSFRGGLRGGLRGLRGGLRGGFRGGFRGGYAGPAGGRDFSQDLYAPYSGPDQAAAGGGLSSYGGSGYGGAGYAAGYDAEPSQQIMVRNVSIIRLVVYVHVLTYGLSTSASMVHCQ